MNFQQSNHREPVILGDRLVIGWQMCDAERDPNRRAQLERHWLQLLREYEQACDRTAVGNRTPRQLQQTEMRVA